MGTSVKRCIPLAAMIDENRCSDAWSWWSGIQQTSHSDALALLEDSSPPPHPLSGCERN